MAQQPTSSHPSLLRERKQSIVERAASAVEAKLSGSGVRRAATVPTVHHPMPQVTTQQHQQQPYADPVFSMNVDDYEIGPPIGYGSSAVVYIAKYKPLKKTVGIKSIDLDMFERNQIDELRREIQIMSLSKHPNLLPVYGSFVHGAKLYIVTPFLSGGSCLDIMKTAFPDGFDEGSIATILQQALQGLGYLHKNGLIHRDVKAGNLLMDQDGLVQLADFGVSSSLMDTGERKGLRKTFVGTPCWMAPEVMEQSGYDYKADIWSFGITALELATGHAPFAKFPPLKVLMLTLQNDPPTLDRDSTKHKYSKSFKEMIDMCLVKDPSRRPTAEKLLSHSFFKQSVKRRQHLVQHLLGSLPPITQRQHNKRAQAVQEEAEGRGISWDFGDETTSASTPRSSIDSISHDSVSSRDSSTRGVSFATNVVVVGSDQTDLPQKKSRFIVDSPVASPYGSTTSLQSDGGSQAETQTPVSATQTTPLANGEVRKGRFSVNQQNPPSLSASSFPSEAGSPRGSDENLNVTVASLERKTGRFAVQTLTQQGSSTASLDRPSRFTVSSESPVTNINIDKKSRFEVSGDSTLTDRLDLLLRQNEMQRKVISELLAAMGRNGVTPTQWGINIPANLLTDPEHIHHPELLKSDSALSDDLRFTGALADANVNGVNDVGGGGGGHGLGRPEAPLAPVAAAIAHANV